ncbi:MAG: hypothetical protein DHS20C18_25450 [Saprospiraceae bacterium]|nr:MAG: hypothetical protein DHS20C18_25450 [Saprospiraceae bacterium]
MKAVTVKELKQELNNRSAKELLELCLRLSKFKKENKELLTYLLFEAADERAYIESVKREMDEQFEQINKKSYYFIRKSMRKILTNLRKYIRYSPKKETEVELLIYFCTKLKHFTPSIHKSTRLQNLYNRLIETIRKKITALHEDLQYDYGVELDAL